MPHGLGSYSIAQLEAIIRNYDNPGFFVNPNWLDQFNLPAYQNQLRQDGYSWVADSHHWFALQTPIFGLIRDSLVGIHVMDYYGGATANITNNSYVNTYEMVSNKNFTVNLNGSGSIVACASGSSWYGTIPNTKTIANIYGNNNQISLYQSGSIATVYAGATGTLIKDYGGGTEVDVSTNVVATVYENVSAGALQVKFLGTGGDTGSIYIDGNYPARITLAVSDLGPNDATTNKHYVNVSHNVQGIITMADNSRVYNMELVADGLRYENHSSLVVGTNSQVYNLLARYTYITVGGAGATLTTKSDCEHNVITLNSGGTVTTSSGKTQRSNFTVNAGGTLNDHNYKDNIMVYGGTANVYTQDTNTWVKNGGYVHTFQSNTGLTINNSPDRKKSILYMENGGNVYLDSGCNDVWLDARSNGVIFHTGYKSDFIPTQNYTYTYNSASPFFGTNNLVHIQFSTHWVYLQMDYGGWDGKVCYFYPQDQFAGDGIDTNFQGNTCDYGYNWLWTQQGHSNTQDVNPWSRYPTSYGRSKNLIMDDQGYTTAAGLTQAMASSKSISASSVTSVNNQLGNNIAVAASLSPQNSFIN